MKKWKNIGQNGGAKSLRMILQTHPAKKVPGGQQLQHAKLQQPGVVQLDFGKDYQQPTTHNV